MRWLKQRGAKIAVQEARRERREAEQAAKAARVDALLQRTARRVEIAETAGIARGVRAAIAAGKQRSKAKKRGGVKRNRAAAKARQAARRGGRSG